MNGLALCAGAGGLELAHEIAFEAYRCIAAVENNPEAALRFKLRFPKAKLFEDVLRFDGKPLYGLVDILFLWAMILVTIAQFSKVSIPAAFLLIPYILWVTFAVGLNFGIFLLNK